MNSEISNLIDKPINDQKMLSNIQKDDKSNSNMIPSLVKYKINPKSDEFAKWTTIKSQYMKLYPKEGSNVGTNNAEIKRRSQTSFGKQSIINTSDKLFLNTKERNYEKILVTPSHKQNLNNDSIHSLKENKNEFKLVSRSNTAAPNELLSAISENKNKSSTVFSKTNFGSSSLEKNIPEKPESSILMNILQNREKEKLVEKEQEKVKQIVISPPVKQSNFGATIINTNANNSFNIPEIPKGSIPDKEKKKVEEVFNFRKPNFNKSYIEEYLRRIHFNGKKEAFEISNDFMNEEDQEIDREIHQFQKKLSEVTDHIKSLEFRKSKRHLKDPAEARYIEQIIDILKEQEPLLTKVIVRDQEKLEMKNEIRTLRSLIETCIKTSDEKNKEHEAEVKSLRELIENFNENKVFSLENENKTLKDERERLTTENKEIQELLEKKSKELSFLYADAENTKESIISELKNLKELKDRLLQEKQKYDQDRIMFGNITNEEKEKKQTFIINEPNQKQEKSLLISNKSKFLEKNSDNNNFNVMNNNNNNNNINKNGDSNNTGKLSKFTAEIFSDNLKMGMSEKKTNIQTIQPIFFKELKEPSSSKGLYYQETTDYEKNKPSKNNYSRSNSNVSSKFLFKLYYF